MMKYYSVSVVLLEKDNLTRNNERVFAKKSADIIVKKHYLVIDK